MARKLTANEVTLFELFMRDNRCCWSCGWFRGKAKIAPDYAAPVRLENHHIVGGSGRKHLRENLARLCSICHRVFHGDRIRLDNGELIPEISLANILFMKKFHDGEYYCVDVLNSLAIGIMPDCEKPDEFFGGCDVN